MNNIERDMRIAFGLEKAPAKAKLVAVTKGWYVKFAVRKIRNGVVDGLVDVFEIVIPTISRIDAEYRAKQEAAKKKLKVWSVLESCSAAEKFQCK